MTKSPTVFCLVLVGWLMLSAGTVRAQEEPRVAIIVVYDTINSTAAIQTWVDEIVSLNYNAVAVHARFRGDATYFPNKYYTTYPNSEPRSSAAGSIDVLEEFVKRGKAKGLKVYAYVNCFLVTDGKNTDTRPAHILNTHPDWVTYAYNGGSPVVQTITHDPDGKWIEPAIPAARTYIANICADIVKNYNCDGIILDRIRYPQASWTRANKDFGYHPTAISAFRAQYGGSGVPNPNDTNWIKFRQDQITKTVQEINTKVKGVSSSRSVYAYPLGRYNDAVNYAYQKWPDWMNSGYVEGVYPQIYTTDNTTFSTRCDENRAAYSGSRLMGIATMAYQSGIDVDGQILIARNKGFGGISPYRHGVMKNLGYWTDLQNVFGVTRIVDNTDSGFTASTSWTTSTGTAGYFGTNFRLRPTASASDTAKWSVSLPSSGSYKVYAWWTAASNRATSAPYIVSHSGGNTTVNVNQRANGGKWNLLGTWNFNSGTAQRVQLSCWTSSGSYVAADAVKLVKQ